MTIDVVVQDWEESEAGWGCRPDGCSLHKSETDRQQYIEQYWAGMPDAVPYEYERPCGEPYRAKLTGGTEASLQESDNGIRLYMVKMNEALDDGTLQPVGNPKRAWQRISSSGTEGGIQVEVHGRRWDG